MEGFYKLPSIINSDSFLIEQLFCLEFERNHHPWSIIRDPFVRRPSPKSHQKLIHGRPQLVIGYPQDFHWRPQAFHWSLHIFIGDPKFSSKPQHFHRRPVNILPEPQMKVLGSPNEKLVVSIMKNFGSPMKF